jgi:hypothetical protein
VVAGRLPRRWSPGQISRWLRRRYVFQRVPRLSDRQHVGSGRDQRPGSTRAPPGPCQTRSACSRSDCHPATAPQLAPRRLLPRQVFAAGRHRGVAAVAGSEPLQACDPAPPAPIGGANLTMTARPGRTSWQSRGAQGNCRPTSTCAPGKLGMSVPAESATRIEPRGQTGQIGLGTAQPSRWLG